MKPLIGAILFVGGAFAFGTKHANTVRPNEVLEAVHDVETALTSLNSRVGTLEERTAALEGGPERGGKTDH
jgi:hypothetical protein